MSIIFFKMRFIGSKCPNCEKMMEKKPYPEFSGTRVFRSHVCKVFFAITFVKPCKNQFLFKGPVTLFNFWYVSENIWNEYV
ncbi:MAG: hypothetical protein NE334_05805 [Lentisphaeraceae bacterium]|nr:hypothetical protein [Lentisphaeraceae bacterium]